MELRFDLPPQGHLFSTSFLVSSADYRFLVSCSTLPNVNSSLLLLLPLRSPPQTQALVGFLSMLWEFFGKNRHVSHQSNNNK